MPPILPVRLRFARFRPGCPATAVLAALAVLLAAGGAGAQEWRGEGAPGAGRAFYTQGGRAAGIAMECRGGLIRTTVAGNGARFPEGRDLTLVLSVDGVARIVPARAELEPGGGGSRFVASEPAAALGGFLAALAGGRELEVSAPSGAIRLALKGSGKAVARLLAGCGP